MPGRLTRGASARRVRARPATVAAGCPGGGCSAGPGPGAALAGVGAAAGYAAGAPAAGRRRPDGVVPFRGTYQAGIITPAQDRLHFVALDLTTDRSAPRSGPCCAKWTAAAERMVAGAETTPGGAVNLNPDAPPADTGEALGLPRGSLTLTFGVGARAVRQARAGRASARPGWPSCRGSPATRSTRRCPAATCASRPAPTTRRSRCTRCATWSGWGSAPPRCAGPSWASGAPPRPRPHRPRRATCSGSRTARTTSRPRSRADLDEHVWSPPGDGPAWLDGGSYLVARRIRMHIEIWDRTSLSEQERIVGRSKGEGAPLGRDGGVRPGRLRGDRALTGNR